MLPYGLNERGKERVSGCGSGETERNRDAFTVSYHGDLSQNLTCASLSGASNSFPHLRVHILIVSTLPTFWNIPHDKMGHQRFVDDVSGEVNS